MTEPATARIDEIIPEEYDLVVLGSGEGAKFIAWTLAKEGQRVAVVERKWIGGFCPNIACLPSKNIIHSAKAASYFKRASEFGGEIMSAVQIAMIAGLPHRALRDAILAHPTLAEGLVVLFSSAPVSVAHDAQEKP